jgi:hypothetical protein
MLPRKTTYVEALKLEQKIDKASQGPTDEDDQVIEILC